MKTFTAIVAACACALVPVNAKAANKPSSAEWQYLGAIANGDIAKAKDLRELGSIDPNRIAGQPAISWVLGGMNEKTLGTLSDEAYAYLINELKQDVNASYWGEDYPVFSSFCWPLFRQVQADPAMFQRSLHRMTALLDAGKVTFKPYRDSGGRNNQQPFASCLAAYSNIMSIRKYPETNQMRTLLTGMLKAGADPNALVGLDTTPLQLAAKRFDAILLAMLVGAGARLDTTTQESARSRCRSGRVPKVSAVLAGMPPPIDKDIDEAAPFLRAIAEHGADPLGESATSCEKSPTLKQRAIDTGQVGYARMMLQIEKDLPTLRQQRPGPDAPAPAAASTAPMDTTPLIGKRRIVATANVREVPMMPSALVTKLAVGETLTIDGETDDGTWSKVTTADGKSGWVINSVLRPSTVAFDAVPVKPAAATMTLAEAQAYVLYGARTPTLTQRYDIQNALGTVTERHVWSYALKPSDGCVVELTSDLQKTEVTFGNHTTTSHSVYRIDFARISAVRAALVDHPAEALLRSFGTMQGVRPNRSPAKIVQLTISGKDAFCYQRKDGTSDCKGPADRAWAELRDLTVTQPKIDAAFKIVKAACAS